MLSIPGVIPVISLSLWAGNWEGDSGVAVAVTLPAPALALDGRVVLLAWATTRSPRRSLWSLRRWESLSGRRERGVRGIGLADLDPRARRRD